LSSTDSPDSPFTRVRKLLALRGLNIWSRATVLECWVEFLPIGPVAADWRERLLAWVPALETQLGKIDSLDQIAVARLLKHITLHLQSRSDLVVRFYKMVPTTRKTWRVVPSNSLGSSSMQHF
jgi:hypothetical protein